jgi:hypothetical protein
MLLIDFDDYDTGAACAARFESSRGIFTTTATTATGIYGSCCSISAISSCASTTCSSSSCGGC